MQIKSHAEREAEAATHLDLAAFHLYHASQVRVEYALPSWDSDDARDMRVESQYVAVGAHKRGDRLARLAVIERVAVVLATANGDIWPKCDNQIHQGLSVERRAVLAAMRRQWYRHQARLVCAEVARFYEMDQNTPEQLRQVVERAQAQQAEDTKIVAAYRGKIGIVEATARTGVRE